MIFALGVTAQQTEVVTREKVVSPETEPQKFMEVVEEKLRRIFIEKLFGGESIKREMKIEDICPIESNLAAKRVFYDYGAIFVSKNDANFSLFQCIFIDKNEVEQFQNVTPSQTETIGGVQIKLQKSAMEALLKARKEARQKGLNITPRGGSIAGTRSFADTLRLWNSRFRPALNYWVRRKKISRQAAANARKMPIQDQVEQVLKWEEKGLYFSTGFNKSILYSVAAPGASQHVFMLALDVKQFNNRRVREILAKNGWYQTVLSDLPHFTYLGIEEKMLPANGLKAKTQGKYKFWIPNK